jgi:hypothetical protein
MKHKKNCQFTPHLIFHSVNLHRLKLNNYFFYFCIISRAVIIQESSYEAYEQVSLVWSPPLLSYLMEQSSSWEVNQFSARQETPCILWNLKVLCPIYTCAPPVLSQPVPFFILGISQLEHKTRSGHCNMQHWRFNSLVCVFIEVFLTALYFSMTYCPPPSELVLHSCKCLMFLSALLRDLGT